MDAEEIDTAAAAAELNILGGLASVTGLQSPAPTRPAGATANDASKDEASSTPSAPAAPSGAANDSPQGAVPATPSAVTITTEQLAMLGGIMATAMKDAMSAAFQNAGLQLPPVTRTAEFRARYDSVCAPSFN